MIYELFIAKMPEHLRNCLIVMKNVSLEELAVTADQIITSSGKMHIEQSLFTIKQDKKNWCSSAEQCDEVSWRINSLESKLNKIVNLQLPSSSESSLNIPTSGHMRSDLRQFKSSQTNNHPRNIRRLNQTPQNICWYHQTFDTLAKKCSPSCNFAAGNGLKSTEIAVKVDGKESPLPHIIDKKTGTKYLVDTGAEVSIERPTRSDLSFCSFKLPLFTANHSPIATIGNKPITLHLRVNQKFTWIFMVVDVKYNIIGADFFVLFFY